MLTALVLSSVLTAAPTPDEAKAVLKPDAGVIADFHVLKSGDLAVVLKDGDGVEVVEKLPAVCGTRFNNGGEGEDWSCVLEQRKLSEQVNGFLLTETAGSHYGDAQSDKSSIHLYRADHDSLDELYKGEAASETHTDEFLDDVNESLELKVGAIPALGLADLIETKHHVVSRSRQKLPPPEDTETVLRWGGTEYAARPARVAGVEASASSQLEEKPRPAAYAPDNLLDNDLTTAWAEGVDGPGIGQSIELTFPKPRTLVSLTLVNGCAASKAIFAANNRLQRVKLSTPAGWSKELDVTDSMQRQVLKIAPPQKTSSVKVEILQVRKGKKFDDTCVTELHPDFGK
jgi:hypothetical protein